MQPEGNFFNLGFNQSDIESLTHMHSVIRSMKAWDILSRRDVPGDAGFVNPRHEDPDIVMFMKALKDLNIDSFGFVMRQMEFIAKYGWEQFIVERRDVVVPRNHLKIKTQV